MQKLFAALCLSWMCVVSKAQFPVSPDSVFVFFRYNSVYRDSVDWELQEVKFKSCLSEAPAMADTMACLVDVLEALNDVHSQIFLHGKYYGHFPEFDQATLDKLGPIVSKCQQFTNQMAVELDANGIAYVLVGGNGGISQEQLNELARELAEKLAALPRKLKGVVLDLRFNGGGSVYPMLAGLGPLLGDGICMHEVDPAGVVTRDWELRNGNFFIGGYQATNIRVRSPKRLLKLPVAVLIGPATRSSGSMVAIAFKTRKNTLFFGEPTADGYSTSNGYFLFSPALTMNFATHFVSDRNGNVYHHSVTPDVLINSGQYDADFRNDHLYQKACDWMLER
jgi:carboxyl-terminal processing protease